MRHDLSILSQTYLNHKSTEISDIIGKGKNQINLEQLPTKTLCNFYLEQILFFNWYILIKNLQRLKRQTIS